MITTSSMLSFPSIRLAALANPENVSHGHHIHERFRGLATFFDEGFWIFLFRQLDREPTVNFFAVQITIWYSIIVPMNLFDA